MFPQSLAFDSTAFVFSNLEPVIALVEHACCRSTIADFSLIELVEADCCTIKETTIIFISLT
jgi:hypothetical protein